MFASTAEQAAYGTAIWGPLDDATHSLLNDGCGPDWSIGAESAGATIVVYDGCGTPTTDIMVTVMDGDTPLRYSLLTDHVLVHLADLPMPPFVDVPMFTLDVSGVPPSAGTIYAAAVPHVGRSTSRRLESSGPPIAGAFSVAGPMPGGTGITLDIRLTRPESTGEQVYFDWFPPDTTGVALGMAPTLPWLDQVTVDPSTRTVSWTETLGAGYNVQVAELRWGDPTLTAGAGHGYRWILIAPPGANTIQWPELPEPLSIHQPAASDTVLGRLRFIDLFGIDTYTEARVLPEWEIVHATDHLSGNTRTAMESVSEPFPPD